MGMISIVDKTPIVKTVGPGDVGPKSRSLRVDQFAIEGLSGDKRLYFPSHFSVTPQFFHRFLTDSGAFDASSLDQARKRIMRAKFILAEKEEITEGLFGIRPRDHFHQYVPAAFMVRSDDYPGGVGLWHSGAASVVGENVDQLVQQILNQMKLILASDFNEDISIFKAMKGITKNPGALIMPVYGKDMAIEDHIFPLFSMNYLVACGFGSVVSIGCGIGGANSIRSTTSSAAYDAITRFFRFPKQQVWTGVNKNTGKMEQINLLKFMRDAALFIGPDSHGIHDFSPDSSVLELTGKVGSRYLELVNADEDGVRPDWVVVQSAPVFYKPIPKPGIADADVVLYAPHAVGAAAISSEKVRLSPDIHPTEEDYAFNEENKGYVLVIDIRSAREFREWGLRFFSNASAIVLNVFDIKNILTSHLGGLMRELGIPVLAGQLSDKFLNSLRREPVQNRHCTVYANEFARQPAFSTFGSVKVGPSEGFLAIEK